MDSDNLIKCNCGAYEYKTLKKGIYNRLGVLNYHFEIWKCKKCDLMRTFPIPPNNPNFKSTLDIKGIKEDNQAVDSWSKMIAYEISKRCPPCGRVLDIGCYTGSLVWELQKLGFQAIGCDIDPAAVKKGIQLGRNIKLGIVSEHKFEDSFFDAVVCNAVLEHILELSSTIQEVGRILKKNGLFFIYVPYCKGLIPKIMGNNWMSWVPQQHVWHFDKKTLQQIVLAKGNFEVISLESKGMIEPPSKGIKGLAKKIIGRTAGFLNFGDGIEAIFIKK